jgi:hypothetical protein
MEDLDNETGFEINLVILIDDERNSWINELINNAVGPKNKKSVDSNVGSKIEYHDL